MALKQRVEYIDLMKGITIIAVLMIHCDIMFGNHVDNMLLYVRMPVYIFLSGLFYSNYSSFKVLIIKKINRYIIPLVFFSIPALVLYSFSLPYASIPQFKSDVYYLITTLDFVNANATLWFLKMLFLLAVLCYAFEKVFKRCHITIRLLIAFTISGLWHIVAKDIYRAYYKGDWFLKLLIDSDISSTLTVFVIFYIAHTIRSFVLRDNHNKLIMTFLLPFAVAILYVFADENVYFAMGLFGDNYFKALIASLAGIYIVYYISYMIKYFPYLSYVGRYSLVILCTHLIITFILQKFLNISNMLVIFAVIIVTAPAVIWLLKRYLPHFTAQKELIKIQDNGKVKISFVD
ncbi:MAG: acyltransferase family protein [Muribaculaceae bacterium]